MSYVGQVKKGSTTHLVGSTLYGTCSTAAATVAKVGTLSDFDSLISGVTVHIKFNESNTATNPTLNVNSTGAKPIKMYGTTAIGTTPATSWYAGSVVSLTYDGTNWVVNDYKKEGGGGGLEHLFDATADGSLRGNTAAAESDTYAVGKGSIAIGRLSKASGENSSAFGETVIASGYASHAEGTWYDMDEIYTTASGYASHAEGIGATASGRGAHAEGECTKASSWNTHAEGYWTEASSGTAHAEGSSTKASGANSHAEGTRTVASGQTSHAGGTSTIAQRLSQTAIGMYNIADTGGTGETSKGDYVFIIGNGRNLSVRSNAMTVDWSGNTAIAGSLTQASDRRLKDHREYLGSKAIEFIRKLKPAYFFKDKKPHVGLYAQDIEGIDPYRTILGEMNGFETVNYTELIPHLITYCQHLEQRIEELERR